MLGHESMVWLGGVITGAGLIALLIAEARGSQVGRWLAKPMASTGFVVVALAAGSFETSFGRVMLVAFALSWLGDVLLIAKGTFLMGLVSFLLGHVGFGVAFALRGIEPWGMGLAALAVALPLLAVSRWLLPKVPAKLYGPVVAYLLVITAMVTLAAGTYADTPMRWDGALIIAGALMFYLSDIAVARQRFVTPSLSNKLWGLPLYYIGQVVLALAAGAAAPR